MSLGYPPVLDEATTLKFVQTGTSLARFGDGEIKLALGHSAKSQQAAPDLAAALRQVLNEVGGHCLACIPRMDFGSPKAAFWETYKRRQVVALYRPRKIYGSAFVTRPDSAPSIDTPEYWEEVVDIWRDRDVVLVRGSTKSLTADRLVGAGAVEEIVGARQHAWAEHAALFERLRRENRRVILCLGATATVLAWRLSHEGVQALDLGHVGMFLRRRGEDGRTGLDYVKGDRD